MIYDAQAGEFLHRKLAHYGELMEPECGG